MKISIIIPVYNTAQFLSHCIDSILGQSIADFELLLVDDGSTDESGMICDEYAVNDGRVRVFHKQNGGVSSARNVGLDNAQGEWIIFVDSDDKLGQDFFVEDFDETVDLVYQHRVFSDGTCESVLPPGIFRGEEYKAFLVEYSQTNLFKMCHGMMLRRTIISCFNIRFNEDLRFGEDRIFIMEYYTHCCSAQVLTSSHYIYNRCENWNNKFVISFHEAEAFIGAFMEIYDRFPVNTTKIVSNAGFISRFIDKDEKYLRLKWALSEPVLRYRKALLSEKPLRNKINYCISIILSTFIHV